MTLDARTIRNIVGALEDERVARIARTGITEAELHEAAARVQAGQHDHRAELGGSPAVHEVILLLERLAVDDEAAGESAGE